MYRNRRFNENRDDDRGGFAPVNVGDELDLKIEAVGEKGDGIAKVKGFVIFVPNAKQGEDVKVKITKVLRKVGFGEIIGKGDSKKEEEPSEEIESNSSEEGYENEETSSETQGSEETQDSEDFGEER